MFGFVRSAVQLRLCLHFFTFLNTFRLRLICRRYAEHTMGGRHVAWSEQFCRPTQIGAPIDAAPRIDLLKFRDET